MGRYPVEFGGRYCEWSTVVDAPVTNLMTLEQLREYVRVEQGQHGLDALPGRLERVARQGTSALGGTTRADLLGFNRAGPNESCLDSEEAIVAHYGEGAAP